MRRQARVQKSASLSAADKEFLGRHIFSELSPGTILHDFQLFLDFIQANTLEASGKFHLLPMKASAILNAQMSHPLAIDLQRPLARYYPHLQVLYLLARLTGLIYVTWDTKKPMLSVNERMWPSWSQLNLTERYFTLLESWLLCTRWDFIGEQRRLEHPLWQCWPFLEDIPAAGLKISGRADEYTIMHYFPGAENLAFFELFGLLLVEHGTPLKGKGWRIVKVARTRFGDAIFKLLALPTVNLSVSSGADYDDQDETDNNPPFGRWQVAFQSLFPDWQKNLELPETPFRDGLYIFKVVLGKTVWRRIAIPARQSFDSLSSAILDAFAFDDDHLYSFTHQDRFGRRFFAYHPQADRRPVATEVLIGDFPLEEGMSMIFHFDFGDDWRFTVTLEQIEPVNSTVKTAKLLEKHGKAPRQYPTADEW